MEVKTTKLNGKGTFLDGMYEHKATINKIDISYIWKDKQPDMQLMWSEYWDKLKTDFERKVRIWDIDRYKAYHHRDFVLKNQQEVFNRKYG